MGKIILNLKERKMILFFLYIILSLIFLLVFLIMFSFIEIHIDNFNFGADKIGEKKLDENFRILVRLKFLNKITLLKLNLDKSKIEKESLKENFSKIENKFMKDKNQFKIEDLSELRNLKIKLDKFQLQVFIGIEDASINAIFVGLVSAIISVALGLIPKSRNKYLWEVKPAYQNRNFLKINLDCIFSFKLIHIIYTIYVLMKKGEKNGRTSNRRAYAYSNE